MSNTINWDNVSEQYHAKLLGRTIADPALDAIKALCAGHTHACRHLSRNGTEWADVTFHVEMTYTGARSSKQAAAAAASMRRTAVAALRAAGYYVNIQTFGKDQHGKPYTTKMTYLETGYGTMARAKGVLAGLWVKL